jgi:peptide/nickel transport system substrate-binding protein
MNLGRRTRRLAGIAVVAVAAMVAAGCSSSSSSAPPGGAATATKGGTATVAFLSGGTPNWIFPFVPIAYYSVYNSQQFQWLMYRPLYLFGDNGTATSINIPLSPANAPVYSNGGKTVTITMKGWHWSNGSTVDAADVAFWLNMMKAEKANYAGYSPGTLPDNLVSTKITSPNTIVLNLTKAYASYWFTYNQLAEITPMPEAWDVTSTGAKAGSGGCSKSPANCKAVFNFLNAQAKDTSSYATSPIWSVEDGPWKLTSFSSSGNDTFAPNPKYSGTPKPQLTQLKYVPYTSDTTMFTALKSGSLDFAALGIGLPPADLSPKPANAALPTTNPLGSAYTLQPMYTFGITYYQINFKNPTIGPAFKQLYFRQALQLLLDQTGIAKAVLHGYAVPGSGAVPPYPPSQWIPTIQHENNGAGPYAFNVAKATSLLTSHGWKMVGGVMTCETPSSCGAGVAKGTQAKISLDVSNSPVSLGQTADVYKSDASKAGVVITVALESFNTIIGKDVPSNPNWDMSGYGGWVFNGPGFAPTGEPLFQTGAGSNSGSYSSSQMDSLISNAQVTSNISAFHDYATYAAQQLPYLFLPEPYTIQAEKANLHAVTYNPYFTFLPEYWYFTK